VSTPTPRKMFVNLPVRHLQRSVEFFTKLGFAFNARFTDENATCMIVGEGAVVMLLVESFFKTFTKRQLCDTRTHTEGLVAISVGSRAEVDHIVKTAVAAGGAYAANPQDHGFMYGWSFYDPDGHHWEVVWVDESATGATSDDKTVVTAKIVPHLWFVDQAVEAANFHVSLFPDSHVDSVTMLEMKKLDIQGLEKAYAG
jgi:predicted lactoylglutathione lyase